MSDAATTAVPADEPGWEWMAVEVFGHRSHAGRVREEERFGAKMLRIDVPVGGDPDAKGWQTHFYGGASIFSLRLIDREAALAANRPYTPPARYALPAPDDELDQADEDERDIPFYHGVHHDD